MKPALPVFVTSNWQLARNMESIGCMAIMHERGEPMPVKFLQGLDVYLDFDRCETAGKVWRLMVARDTLPRSCRAWCRCARAYVTTCGACDTGGEPWAG